jgi:hypothetical protein
LRVGRCTEMAYHGEFVAEYRGHDGQTSRNTRELWRSIHRMLTEQKQYTAGDSTLERARRSALLYWTVVSRYQIAVQDAERLKEAGRSSSAAVARLKARLWGIPYKPVRFSRRNKVVKVRRQLDLLMRVLRDDPARAVRDGR